MAWSSAPLQLSAVILQARLRSCRVSDHEFARIARGHSEMVIFRRRRPVSRQTLALRVFFRWTILYNPCIPFAQAKQCRLV